MENDSTFVAPEGVYSVTEEHKHSLLGVHTVNASPVQYPTYVRTATVKFASPKAANSQVLSQFLGVNREKDKKDKRDDGLSVSSSETPDDVPSPEPSTSPDSVPTPILPHDQLTTIFSQSPAQPGKKKLISRPKHSMRTTSSTFITRLQNVDNLSRNLQSKQGEITFLFYNSGKSFIWAEVGSKLKVRFPRLILNYLNRLNAGLVPYRIRLQRSSFLHFLPAMTLI
jgi:catabolite repression protein CreC